MKIYTAKYYPLVNGKEEEYTTIVEAKDKASAETAIRKAFVEQLERMAQMISMYNMTVIGQNPADIPKNIEYAKNDMRVVII